MRLPRLTTRRLMVVVAVVAALLAGWIEAQMRRRRAEYRREASRCAQAESVFRLLALGDATRIAAWEGSDPSRRAAAAYFARSKGSCRELAEYYTLQRKRYERAADRPWVPLPPGPPEPSVGSGIPD